MNAITAIPTTYKGMNFRSRLEARVAATLDAIGVDWDYEPEAFVLLDGSGYLPDFWLPKSRSWLEVKPEKVLYDQKAGLFAEACDDPIFIAQPMRMDVDTRLSVWRVKNPMSGASAVWVRCPDCKVIQPANIGAETLRCCGYAFPYGDPPFVLRTGPFVGTYIADTRAEAFWDAHYGTGSLKYHVPWTWPMLPQYQDGRMIWARPIEAW